MAESKSAVGAVVMLAISFLMFGYLGVFGLSSIFLADTSGWPFQGVAFLSIVGIFGMVSVMIVLLKQVGVAV